MIVIIKDFLFLKKRVRKYVPLLQDLCCKQWVSYAEIETMVGKLASLECAVFPGMWYTRNQYAAMRVSGVKPEDRKSIKNFRKIKVTHNLRGMVHVDSFLERK